MILRVEKTENYVILDKRFLNNANISWQAKGLLAYMLALPNDWQFNVQDLKKRSKNGRDATKTIINELVAAGYIQKEQIRTAGKFGKVDYVVRETPLTDNPSTEKPSTENPPLLNNNTTNNKTTNKDLCHKRVYDADSNEMVLVNYFIKRIKINNPNFKEPNKQKWADTFRKIIELDHREPRVISELILFVQTDDFEMSNVMSPEKLRKRFDSLLVKKQQKVQKIQKQNTTVQKPQNEMFQFNPDEGEDD